MTELIIGGILLILAIIIYRANKNKPTEEKKTNDFDIRADDTVLPIPQKPPKGNP
jgi:hypothetical protein